MAPPTIADLGVDATCGPDDRIDHLFDAFAVAPPVVGGYVSSISMDPLVAAAVIAAVASVLAAMVALMGVAVGVIIEHRLGKSRDLGDRLRVWQLERLRAVRSLFVASFATWDAIAAGDAERAERAQTEFDRFRFENVRLVGNPSAISAWQEYITRSRQMLGRTHTLEDHKYLGTRMHAVLRSLDDQEIAVLRGDPMRVISEHELDSIFSADAWAEEMRMPNVPPNVAAIFARIVLDGLTRFRRPTRAMDGHSPVASSDRTEPDSPDR